MAARKVEVLAGGVAPVGIAMLRGVVVTGETVTGVTG